MILQTAGNTFKILNIFINSCQFQFTWMHLSSFHILNWSLKHCQKRICQIWRYKYDFTKTITFLSERASITARVFFLQNLSKQRAILCTKLKFSPKPERTGVKHILFLIHYSLNIHYELILSPGICGLFVKLTFLMKINMFLRKLFCKKCYKSSLLIVCWCNSCFFYFNNV